MQAEANIVERFIHAYVTYRAARLLCILAVAGAALLLFLLSGGFPPWAWRLLFQTLPQASTLLALRGQAALLALIGLALLSVTLLLAWWALLWLAWRMLAYWLYERQELRRFAADMQEAQYLAQDEEEQYAYADQHADTYQYADQLEEDEYAYQDEEEAYAEEPAPFWAYTGARVASGPPPGLMSAPGMPQVQGSVGPVPTNNLLPPAARGYIDNLPPPVARMHTDNLPSPVAPASTNNLPSPVARVSTDNLQHTSYGLFEAFTPPAPVTAPPAAMKAPPMPVAAPPRQYTAVYQQESMPTVPLPAEPDARRTAISLVVSTGLDEGLKRKGKPNEDSLLVLKNTRLLRGMNCPVGLFVIADGMGGHENGQEASRLVIQAFSSNVMPTLLTGPADDNYAELLTEGVHHANLVLYQRNRQTQGDMGTTLAAAMIVNTTAYIANVGDSRVYLYRAASGLSQVTRDHSTVARLVETGVLQPEEIYTHPRRNEIYRSLGHRASEEVDTFTLALQPGDLLMLCSDGLWEMVRDTKIQCLIASNPSQPAQLSANLVQAALDGGGKDNIGVILVYVQAEEEARSAWAS